MTTATRLKRALTLQNLKLVGTALVAVASIFGVIAPETATRLRNEVLLPLGAVSSMTAGDL